MSQILPEIGPSHQFSQTIVRPDGVTVTATITVPEGHKLVAPAPVTGYDKKGERNSAELSEYAFMAARKVYQTLEQCEESRRQWDREDFYDELNIPIPTPAIEPKKED